MLDELVLHDRTRKLADKLAGNLPHALVIEGPNGSGVLTVAKALAKSMGSPDLVIQPKKSVNGQMVIDPNEGNIIIEDIRMLYQQTRTKQPDSHVYILDTGERSMTVAAQNAFLKLLEEPRPGLHFIIATHHPDQLLPTITSRSQRLSLLPVSDKQTKDIVDSLNIDNSTKNTRLLFVGRGLPALIKRLAMDEKTYENRVAIMSDAKTMIGGAPYEKLTVIHRYRDNRAGALTLIDDMNYQLQVIIQSKPDPKLIEDVARNLKMREKVLAGGAIRLQLTAGVL